MSAMGVTTPTILSGGKAIDATFELVALSVTTEVNRVPRAELRLLDGSAAKRTFPISDGTAFAPGATVEIRLRYEGGEETSVFTGLVVRHGIEAAGLDTFLNVELRDAAVTLTRPRKSAVYVDQTDDAVIGALIKKAGLAQGEIAATQPAHEQLVQYHCSDWDFIVTRADAHGLLVVVEAGEVSVRKPDLRSDPKHSFEFGLTEIFGFEMEIDAGDQPSGLETLAWDAKAQALTPATSAKPFSLAQGNLQGQALADQVGFAPTVLTHGVPLDPPELQAWADATVMRRRLAMIRGRIAIEGFGDVALLDPIELTGVGKRFKGKTLVTGINHRLTEDGWRTDVQFGLSPAPFASNVDIAEPPAAGLLPGVSGLQTGVVDAFEEDPTKELRVRVIVPSVDGVNSRVWARLASPDAGAARGFFFRPEVGDEVVLGFLNDDPRRPVILGSLFGSKNAPPTAVTQVTAENVHKALVSRGGATIGFSDEDKSSVFIETAGGSTVRLDDATETVRVADGHGNELTMGKDGIVIKSAKDLTFEASGKVEIKGQKVDIT